MSLKRTTAINLGAVGSLHIFAKILNLITLTILSRLLLPSDFGIVAIAGIMITVVDQFKDFGISNAVINRHENPEESLMTGFTIRLFIGSFFYVAIFFLAPVYGNFFNDQVIASVLRVSAIVLILENLRFTPDTKLRKELKFKTIVISNFFGYVSYSIVAISLAYAGYSFWSIIYARLIQTLTSSIYFWFKSPWKFKLYFNKEIAKELYSYGKYIFITGFLALGIDNMNNFVLGKIVGSTLLGYYVVAYSWATFSSREMIQIISKVLFPTFSSIKNDIPRIGNAYLKSLRYTSMISIPIALGTLAIAPEFVNVILGEKWTPSILPLQILCIVGLLQSLNTTTSSLYYSLGKAKITTIMAGTQLLLMMLFVIPVAKIYGIIGVTVLYSLVIIIMTPFNFVYIGKYLQLNQRKFAKILIIPAISGIIMALFIFLIKDYLKSIILVLEYPLLNLILLVLSGGVMYVLCLFILTKGSLKKEIMDIALNMKHS